MNEILESFQPMFKMLWGALFLVIALKLFFWWWNSPKRKGARGEKLVAGRLRKGLPEEYLILNDIYLPAASWYAVPTNELGTTSARFFRLSIGQQQ